MAKSIVRKNFIDYTGKEIANSTVLGIAGRNKYGTVIWRLLCEHGKEWTCISGNLKNKKCCPCLSAQLCSDVQKKHGHTKSGGFATREYAAWQSMQDRCSNENTESYPHYGGRGIRVSERWKGEHGFENFLADMGPRPSDKHSIDRFPDMNGNYEPGNCRWATWKEQRNNSRQNVFVVFRGKKATVIQHLEELGISNPAYVYSRLKSGWSVEDAFSVPRHKKRKGVPFQVTPGLASKLT